MTVGFDFVDLHCGGSATTQTAAARKKNPLTDGELGVEVLVLRDGELLHGRRFATRCAGAGEGRRVEGSVPARWRRRHRVAVRLRNAAEPAKAMTLTRNRSTLRKHRIQPP